MEEDGSSPPSSLGCRVQDTMDSSPMSDYYEFACQMEEVGEDGGGRFGEMGYSLSFRTCSSAPSSSRSVRSLSIDKGDFPPMSEWEEIASRRWLLALESPDARESHPTRETSARREGEAERKPSSRRWLLPPFLRPRFAFAAETEGGGDAWRKHKDDPLLWDLNGPEAAQYVCDHLYGSFRGNSVSSTGAIAGGVAAGAALPFAAPAIGFAWWRRKLQEHFFDVPAEEDPEVHLGQLKRFSLRELQVATNSFSNKNILVRGGFYKVYQGRLADGSLVAVKRLKEERTPAGEHQFQTEVETISMAVHRNLLRLRGFCMTPTERLIVYPYTANGSVASRLRERPKTEPPLDWPTRKRIALGSARGLSYLHDDHCGTKIIHCDVKAANILLDEEFEAVVGGFGLAMVMDYKDTHVTTAVRGTIGHIAPEYLSTGKCSEKTDVFGYGIMLLELITGQRAFDLARLANDDDVMLLDWVKGLLKEKKLEMLVDPDLPDYVDAEVEQLIQVALLGTQGSPMDRPKMTEVVKMLEGDGLAERWEEWQRVEVVRHEVELAPHRNSEWIIDSTDNLHAVELSGPR